MSAQKHIKTAMIDKGIKSGQLAQLCGVENKQVFYNLLSRETLQFNEAEKIADILNCDIYFVERDTKKFY